MPDLINCRFCRGPRDVRNGICMGCGSPAANAKQVERKRPSRTRIACPRCKSVRSSPHSDGTRICRECGTEFEQMEVFFADDRPEHNAMKRGL